ncbi:hypothetical protein DAEQUDRAFT_724898 [Daedalea quercina L-15889]|uniref:Chromo domain-containing protein n=1 Tax=Daedalea quercina L-15889 TaxID=1314783 RepID=A0A165RHT2_9APHY|nr:hypothetical protein DAEQUDRAFT_724898 [Daedalea quercina L-15889]
MHSDSESDAGARSSSKKDKAISRDSAMDVDEENGGEEEGEEGDEEEYEIEKILDAKIGMFAGGRMGYLVKWKGYGDEHNSWVDEQDAGNANVLIDDYWAKNKKDKRGGRKSTGRPAGRPSTASARKSSTVREESSEIEEVRPKKRGRPSKAKREEQVDDDVEEVEEEARKKTKRAAPRASRDGPTEDADGFVPMKQWKDAATWEHIVSKIDTVERTDTGDLLVYFTLRNGSRSRENSKICGDKMPKKLLEFYETNLRWRVIAGEE